MLGPIFYFFLEQVQGDDADDPSTYLVSFDDDVARYVVCITLGCIHGFHITCCGFICGFLDILVVVQPLPTKLSLKKKKAKEGRTNEEVEQFPIPSKVTVRRRPTTAVQIKESEVLISSGL